MHHIIIVNLTIFSIIIVQSGSSSFDSCIVYTCVSCDSDGVFAFLIMLLLALHVIDEVF